MIFTTEMFNKYNSNSSYNSFTADFYYNDFKQLFLDNTSSTRDSYDRKIINI